MAQVPGVHSMAGNVEMDKESGMADPLRKALEQAEAALERLVRQGSQSPFDPQTKQAMAAIDGARAALAAAPQQDSTLRQIHGIVTRELAEPGTKENTGMLMRIAELCEDAILQTKTPRA